MSEAAEKAGEAAVAAVIAESAVEQRIDAVKADAADLVEIAADRAEAAEEAAQAIADAAMMTELGRRIDGLCTEVQACRAENQSLAMEISGLKSTLTDLSSKLPPNLIAPLIEQPPAPKGSLTPGQSDKTEVVLAENPSDGDEDGPKGPEAKSRRRRFAL